MNEPLMPAVPTQNAPKRRLLVRATAAGILTLGVVWASVHFFHTHANVQQTVSTTPQSPPTASMPAVPSLAVSPPVVSSHAVSPPATAASPASNAASLPTVVHQEIPDVSRSARESIRGVIKITARVVVDRSGNVVSATLNNRGPSKYFARAAMDAAKKWKFAQTSNPGSRVWLLHFGFARTGTTAHAAALQ